MYFLIIYLFVLVGFFDVVFWIFMIKVKVMYKKCLEIFFSDLKLVFIFYFF